jgi:hypothetical protein
MIKGRLKGHDGPNERFLSANVAGIHLRGEEEILQSIATGGPLPDLLNRICSALDCEIGNVVSLISLLDENAAEYAVMAGNAKHFGLHMFCSIGVIAENCTLLGTLEMYACKPWSPTLEQLDLIEHASCLAAIAIEREIGAVEEGEAEVLEMRPIRKRAPGPSENVN